MAFRLYLRQIGLLAAELRPKSDCLSVVTGWITIAQVRVGGAYCPTQHVSETNLSIAMVVATKLQDKILTIIHPSIQVKINMQNTMKLHLN